FVDLLARHLRTADLDVWVDDESLRPGQGDWEREIRKVIAASDGVIYVGSEDAADSTYVRSELPIAHNNNIIFFPIWAPADKVSRCAALSLGPAQYSDGRGDKFDSAV